MSQTKKCYIGNMNNKSLKQQSASYYIDINDNDKSRENDSCNSK